METYAANGDSARRFRVRALLALLLGIALTLVMLSAQAEPLQATTAGLVAAPAGIPVHLPGRPHPMPKDDPSAQYTHMLQSGLLAAGDDTHHTPPTGPAAASRLRCVCATGAQASALPFKEICLEKRMIGSSQ
jgi:hypothetical protein